ncbi:hypothetical protein SKAU_G00251940 [Synaphobranchus kaupii]|uniref:Uncharacterized protein n=1 Tax=Synaphobranchus kaupii TaxID=118154 RepID=A0A9Q1F303_SYNKA|nr:hypothetical protein SKAU_G00251940 [Synaphobranchus kaupii]
MHRAFSFPMTADRSRNKERLEASLAGLCELELLKQRQECLVLSALSLGDTVPGHPAWGDLQPPLSAPTGPSRVQDDLTLRRQLPLVELNTNEREIAPATALRHSACLGQFETTNGIRHPSSAAG